MIVNDFSKVVMGSLFGDLAGISAPGFQFLALGAGSHLWELSGTVPPVAVDMSGLANEFHRVPPSERLFLTDLVLSGTYLSGVSTSGLVVGLPTPYPDYHFNDLVIILNSGTNLIRRIIDSYTQTSLSGTILFDNSVSGLNSKDQLSSGVIGDVRLIAGEYDTQVFLKFHAYNHSVDQNSYMEEGLVGGQATKTVRTGNFANIVRFKNKTIGGTARNIHRDLKFVIPSGFFVK